MMNKRNWRIRNMQSIFKTELLCTVIYVLRTFTFYKCGGKVAMESRVSPFLFFAPVLYISDTRIRTY